MTIALIVITSLNLIASAVVLFFKSYVGEKGKNLATKQDIELITEKIETVKSEFGVLTQRRIAVMTQRDNTLIEFLSKSISLINFLMNVNVLSDENEQQLSIKRSNDMYYELQLSKAKVMMFFYSNYDLMRLLDNMESRTIDLITLVNKNFVICGIENMLLQASIKSENLNQILISELRERIRSAHMIFTEKKIDIKEQVLEPLKHQLITFINEQMNIHEIVR